MAVRGSPPGMVIALIDTTVNEDLPTGGRPRSARKTQGTVHAAVRAAGRTDRPAAGRAARKGTVGGKDEIAPPRPWRGRSS